MKKIMFLIFVIFLIGCSSAQDRIDSAKSKLNNEKNTNELNIIYQETKISGDSDVIVFVNNKTMYIVEVSMHGNVRYITEIPKNIICKGDLYE